MRARVLGPVLAAAVLAGCYDAPLGPASMPFDARLYGEWRCLSVTNSDEPLGVLRIVPFDATHGELTCVKGCEGDTLHYRLHVTKVRAVTLLNAQAVEEGKPTGTWNFLRYELHRPTVLDVRSIHDEVFKGVPETSDALRAALSKRVADDATYDDDLVCAKAGAAGETR
jgi:hypothetical protein